MVFGNSNAFQRKLIYQVVQKDFNDEVTATSQTLNNQKVIVIERKWSMERKQQEVELQNEEDEGEYRRLVGLSALLMKISKSVSAFDLYHSDKLKKFNFLLYLELYKLLFNIPQKKPIVGHNMFMDLFYLIRQFFEPLAGTLKSFKKQSHKIFPK